MWSASLSACLLVVVSGVPIASDDHRIIIRYADAGAHGGNGFVELDKRVRALQAKSGVVTAKGLLSVGMIVVACESEASEEQLIKELDSDPEVELATPDTWVHFDGSAGLTQGQTTTQEEAVFDDWRKCSAQSSCAALGEAGNCCPASNGTFLACCDGPTIQNLIGLQSFHGKYVVADINGALNANVDELHTSEQFQIFHNDDGTVSLRSHFGKYVTAEPFMPEIGGVYASSDVIGDNEKFELVRHQGRTVSLKSHHGWYLSAQGDGAVYANRPSVDDWEKFKLVFVDGPSQRFPNDANFSALWGMHHYNNHDIGAPEAWRKFTGEFSAGIIVGVIDTGIDYTHEDLRENMWVNPREIPDNGIDDDLNGYIDDVHGADFANEDGDPMDDQMHGTHCSGTIAGTGNNGIGVTGVAWRGVKLMGLKFLSASGQGRSSDAIKAIDYAVAHGAKILSNSWGGGGSSAPMRMAIEKAEAAGILFVAAAGNAGSNNDVEPHFPSNYAMDNVVSVASTTYEGVLSGFSCYGATTVDIAAPGSGIFSTVPNQGYSSLSGTSMACPHVSGLAALIWMYRPKLEMMQVKEILMQSVTRTSALDGKVSTAGRINAKKALELASAFEAPYAPSHAPQAVAFEDVDSRVGFIAGVITIIAAADESDVEYYTVYFVSGAGFQLDTLGTVNVTGEKQLFLTLNGSLSLPRFAAGIVAISGNATGEMPAQLGGAAPNATLRDYGLPEYNVRGATWSGDADPRAGFLAGNITVSRAADEGTISEYNIYWSRPDGTRGLKLGSCAAAGFVEPRCTGPTCHGTECDEPWSQGPGCSVLNASATSSGRNFSRTNYENNEEATIVFSGPATVIVTSFDTEEHYDILKIGANKLSGQLTVPFELTLPEGLQQIAWTTDESETAPGWSLELVQAGSEAVFEIAATAAGTRVEIVPSYFGTERPTGVFVEIIDSTTLPLNLPSSSDAATHVDPGARRLHSHSAMPKATPPPPLFEAEPWLEQQVDVSLRDMRVFWSAHTMPSTAHVMCALTVPGLPAEKVTASMRVGIADAIDSGLPYVDQLHGVFITRMLVVPTSSVISAIQPRGRQLSSAVLRSLSDHQSATRIEFIVVPALGASTITLDRIEARLILLSKGGDAAKVFDASLNAVFEAAGLPLGTRTRIHEPQEVVPKKSQGRALAATRAAVADDTTKQQDLLPQSDEDDTEDATFKAVAIAGAVAVFAVIAALRWSRQRRFDKLQTAITCVNEEPCEIRVHLAPTETADSPASSR